jgi:mannose-6-phosphate isomerase-like protein (cupin superfamily)
MHHVRKENLPFVGSSHEFVGAQQGNTGVSVFLFHGKPGSGPGPHRHPYDEVQFIQEGHGIWTVDGKTFEGSAGDIFIIKAGEVHSFKATGLCAVDSTRRAHQPTLHSRELVDWFQFVWMTASEWPRREGYRDDRSMPLVSRFGRSTPQTCLGRYPELTCRQLDQPPGLRNEHSQLLGKPFGCTISL